jgi:hypothetical protein
MNYERVFRDLSECAERLLTSGAHGSMLVDRNGQFICCHGEAELLAEVWEWAAAVAPDAVLSRVLGSAIVFAADVADGVLLATFPCVVDLERAMEVVRETAAACATIWRSLLTPPGSTPPAGGSPVAGGFGCPGFALPVEE